MLDRYKALLDRYHACIRKPGWWDGSATALAREMDALWPKLTRQEQAAALRHAEELCRGFRWPAG